MYNTYSLESWSFGTCEVAGTRAAYFFTCLGLDDTLTTSFFASDEAKKMMCGHMTSWLSGLAPSSVAIFVVIRWATNKSFNRWFNYIQVVIEGDKREVSVAFALRSTEQSMYAVKALALIAHADLSQSRPSLQPTFKTLRLEIRRKYSRWSLANCIDASNTMWAPMVFQRYVLIILAIYITLSKDGNDRYLR